MRLTIGVGNQLGRRVEYHTSAYFPTDGEPAVGHVTVTVPCNGKVVDLGGLMGPPDELLRMAAALRDAASQAIAKDRERRP